MGRKRESVCSEVTTTTTFITNGSNLPHHTFHHQKTSKQLLPLHQLPPSNYQNNTIPIHHRQFRHSQPNLTQISSFMTTRCSGDACDPGHVKALDIGTTTDAGIQLPLYRPVSRSSNRSASPFDPPNIPMITPTNPDLPDTSRLGSKSADELSPYFLPATADSEEDIELIPTPTDIFLQTVLHISEPDPELLFTPGDGAIQSTSADDASIISTVHQHISNITSKISQQSPNTQEFDKIEADNLSSSGVASFHRVPVESNPTEPLLI